LVGCQDPRSFIKPKTKLVIYGDGGETTVLEDMSFRKEFTVEEVEDPETELYSVFYMPDRTRKTVDGVPVVITLVLLRQGYDHDAGAYCLLPVGFDETLEGETYRKIMPIY
jgi:hypothetical protein